MSRKLASIVEIESCEPIPDTERLSVATMKGKGWKVVTGRDEFHRGDLASYFEIDSFLPSDDPRYAFLRERCLRKFVSKGGNVLREGIRIKTCKLRGVVSQGLLMPLSAFVGKEILVENHPARPEDVVSEDGSPVTQEELEGVYISTLYYNKEVTDESGSTYVQKVEVGVDSDLTELLHVEHHDEVKEQLQPAMGNPMSADAMGPFPTAFIPKTDEPRIQNLGDWFETMKGRKWEITCKHDGTSCTIAYAPSIDAENPVIVCSRNLRLKPQSADGKVPVYWQMANKYDIPNKVRYHFPDNELAVQGEIVGPGINGDRNREKEYEFKCFRIWDITAQRWMNPNECSRACDVMGIPHVEVVATDYPFFDKIPTMELALTFAEGETLEGNEREGVVLKTCDDGPFMSCKIINNNYLLKQKD